MEVAIARLDAAGDRAKQCDELRLAALAELADLQATRKHAKGRPPKAFCAKVHKIEQELRRLEQNVLPGEMPPSAVVQRRTIRANMISAPGLRRKPGARTVLALTEV